jgi:hypothetical protein
MKLTTSTFLTIMSFIALFVNCTDDHSDPHPDVPGPTKYYLYSYVGFTE